MSDLPIGDRLKSVMNDINALWSLLQADKDHLNKCKPEQANDSANNSHCRIAIRTWFATIEGMTNGMLWAIHQAEVSRIEDTGQVKRFADSEMLAMIEKGWMVDSNGNVKMRDQHITLLSKIRMLFSILENLNASNWRVDYGSALEDVSWEDLRNAVKVRNRLTHPRHPKCLNLDDEDFECCLKGYNWWDANMARFLHPERFDLQRL